MLYDVNGAKRFYQRGPAIIEAVAGVDLRIDAGELVALEGPSGPARRRCCSSSGLSLVRAQAPSASRDATSASSGTASWPSSG